MVGVRDAQIYAVYGQAKYAGNIVVPFFPSSCGQLLTAAIGADTVSGAGPYTHTIKPSNTLQSLTLEKNVGGLQSEQYPGGRVRKITAKSAADNNPLELTFEVESLQPTILTTPTTVTIPTTSGDIPFVFAEASVTLMGGTVGVVTDVQFEIDNGLKATYTLQTTNPHAPAFLTPTALKVKGTCKAVFRSLNDAVEGWFNKALPPAAAGPGTQGQIAVTWAHTTPAWSLQFNLPQCNIKKIGDTLKMEDLTIQDLAFEASYSPGSAYTLQAVLVNGTSSGY